MIRFRTRVCVQIFVLLCAAAVLPLAAAPPPPPIITVNPAPIDCFSGAGCLDPMFGGTGKVVQDIGGNPQYAYAVAAQADGKVVVVGSTRFIATPNDFSWRIVRFNADGTLDTGFGAGGMTGLDLITTVNNIEQARAVAIQPDGKIVVAGWGLGTGQDYVAVLRLNPSGTPDSTFGSGGKMVITSLGPNYILTAMAIQPDGKIVAVAGLNDSQHLFSTIFRLLPNGSLDKQWGSKGFRALATAYDNVLALQSNGNIILGGGNGSGDAKDFVLTRLTSSGVLDNRFGNRGTVAVNFFGYEDELTAIAVASDDSIIVGGRANTAAVTPGVQLPPTFNMALARFTANGALATSFGNGGKLVLDMNGGGDAVSDVAIQSNGAILFGGHARLPDDSNGFFIAGRLTAAGALDATFGTGGVTETAVSFDDKSGGMTMDSAGHVYVVGDSYFSAPTGNPNTWLVARYFR